MFGLVNVLKYLRKSEAKRSILAGSTTSLLEESVEGSGRDEDYPNGGKLEPTTPDQRAVIEMAPNWHEVDIPIGALQVLSEQTTAQKVIQAVIDYQRSEFLINSIKAAASKGKDGIAVMQLLLQQQGSNYSITEDVLKAAAESKSVELMQLFLSQQGADVLITEQVINAAAMDLANCNCIEVLLLLLDQPRASTLITEEVWEAISGFYYSDRVTLLESLLGKITITEEMTATFVRIFSRESVQILLDQRGADVSITVEVMKAALENVNWSEELALLLFNRYESEASEALMLLGEEGKIFFERKDHSFCVKSSARWIDFPLKGTTLNQPGGSSVVEEVDEVDEVKETEGATSTPLLPLSQIEGLMKIDSTQDQHASSPNHTGIHPRSPTRVSLPSMQQVYRSIRRGLSILPWIETPILPGHQRIYWRNVSTSLVHSFISSWMQDEN